MQIRPLRRGTLGSDIARQIHDMIQSGDLQPGDRLPGHRELMERFGASMAAVREAVSALSAAGLLDSRPGRGTLVLGLEDAEPQFDGWLGFVGNDGDLGDFLEARRLLETFLARQAAKRATPEHLARLQKLLEAMARSVRDPDAYVEADFAFHMGIAEVAGNRVLIRVMRAIQAPMKHQLHESNIRHIARSGHLSVSFDTHERMVAAIRQGDGDAAVSCIVEMVDRSARLLKERMAAE